MPSSSFSIDQVLASLGKATRGAHQRLLDPKTLSGLRSFATHLVKVEGKSPATAQVYKSLCAKAIAQGGPDPNNPMMMSALRALQRWKAN